MTEMMIDYLACVTLPMAAGFALDALFGDPLSRFHPVVLTGKLISFFDRKLRRGGKRDFYMGILTAAAVFGLSALIPALFLLLLKQTLGIWAVCAASSLHCWQMLAAKDLQEESMKVCAALERDDTEAARQAVSMIVGRDTDQLDRGGMIRAAVETVAENTSDGVTAPLFYMALFGIPGIFFYKGVNTMDSMIGYKNEKYILFGRAAAKMDDILNFIPARLTALLMILAAFLLPELDGRAAAAVFRRDRRKSASPNAGCTESVTAGALHVRLLGPAYYFGRRVEKPYIGNDDREVEAEDIRLSCRLMYLTSVMMLILCLLLQAGACLLLFRYYGTGCWPPAGW